MPNSQGKSPTIYVVCGTIGLGLIAVIFSILNWKWALVALAYLLYEGWTLVNKYENDTISEIIWLLSKRPMVPWLFGLATGWALGADKISNVYLIAGLFFLQGHFFFQRQDRHD